MKPITQPFREWNRTLPMKWTILVPGGALIVWLAPTRLGAYSLEPLLRVTIPSPGQDEYAVT